MTEPEYSPQTGVAEGADLNNSFEVTELPEPAPALRQGGVADGSDSTDDTAA
jgi:hypothetical protein